MRYLVPAVLALSSLVACGGDDDVVVAIDAPIAIDAPVVCPGSTSSFGALGDRTGPISYTRFGPGAEDYIGLVPVKAGMPFDGVLIELLAGAAQAPDPLTTGTFPLSGRNGSNTTCAQCVRVWTANTGTTPPEWVDSHTGEYQAIGGTMTIATLDHEVGGTIDLTLTDVMFQRVSASGAPTADGCAITLASMHVTTTLTAAE